MLLIAGIGAVFYYAANVEGAIFPDSDDCEPGWFTPEDPDTEEPYTSKDALREDVLQYTDMNESRVDDYMGNAELRDTENGTIVQLQEVCS